jgi:hypothetical protein
MHVGILTGNPYEACENDAFSQVRLKPLVRFSHCANGAPARTTMPNLFLNFYPMKKIQIMKKVINPPLMFLVQIFD